MERCRQSHVPQAASDGSHLPPRPQYFALVLPGTDLLNAKRTAVRLQEERGRRYAKAFDIIPSNYPQDLRSAYDLEDIVKPLLPEAQEWETPVAALS